MLVRRLKTHEQLEIGDGVIVKVIRTSVDVVRLGISSPPDTHIFHRGAPPVQVRPKARETKPDVHVSETPKRSLPDGIYEIRDEFNTHHTIERRHGMWMDWCGLRFSEGTATYLSPIERRGPVGRRANWRRKHRAALMARRAHCCYCRIRRGTVVDHVHPRAKGGADRPENILLACHRCDSMKENKSLEEFAAELERTARHVRDLAAQRAADAVEYEQNVGVE